MKPILFVCASDTLVHLLLPVAQEMERLGFVVKLATLMYTREKAEFMLGYNIKPDTYVGVVRYTNNWLNSYSCVVVGNDWGDEVKALINHARKYSMPSICIQESVIDFSGPKKRMRHADYAFVQGEISHGLLKDRNSVLVTGNPRYDKLIYCNVENRNLAFINVNFTYGVEESNRSGWVKAAISACEKVGFKPLLVQHPRDLADLSIYRVEVIKSNASVIHDIIRSSSILITRFSSLIHEAICLGRPVCYFDPFSENIYYNFTPDDIVLKKANDSMTLERSLKEFWSYNFQQSDFSNYLSHHLLRSPIPAAQVCATHIGKIIQNPSMVKPKIFGFFLIKFFLLLAISKDIYRALI